jgi:DNA polymerase-3 subunit delta
MAELKPAYLIHGDDHGAIAERRARLRALAEAQGGACGVELLEGEQATPAGLAGALCAMTFAVGWRVILVEGVERWKPAEAQKELQGVMGALPPQTTVALFAREDARLKAPPALHKAVLDAGGQVVAETAVKPWELPKWVRAQGARLGLELDSAAAKALVAQVGERQQRLLRELEKLALEVGGGEARERGDDAVRGGVDGAVRGGVEGAVRGGADEAVRGGGDSAVRGGADGAVRGGGKAMVAITIEDIEARAAHSAERRVYALADALVAGDAPAATRTYLSVRAQGERLSGLSYLMAARLREALVVSLRLRAGESAAEVKRSLRMPARAAERFLADVAATEPERLRAALCVLADLELDTRGGDPVSAHRSRRSGLQEDTLALGAIQAITA